MITCTMRLILKQQNIKENQEVVEHLLDKTKEDAIERSESYNKLATHMKK